ncbi:hypothetical protein BHE74_00042146 [Ensete ventricosum]|nr:hypothetical protein GW17_00028361 [Ensete ventricosum]RWW51501.1 hypothetical protein BHE74_00042146 [Ensete ventricosum]
MREPKQRLPKKNPSCLMPSSLSRSQHGQLLLLPPSTLPREGKSQGCALAYVMLTASAGKWSRNRCEAHGPVRFDGRHIVQVNLDGEGERDRLRCLCHTHACRDK